MGSKLAWGVNENDRFPAGENDRFPAGVEISIGSKLAWGVKWHREYIYIIYICI